MTSVPPARTPDAAAVAEGDADAETGTSSDAGSGSGSGSSAAPATPSRSRGARRALGLALLFGALGAALALVASGQVWGSSAVPFAQSELSVQVKGSDVTGLPSALALVGLAALVAVFAVRRAGRVLVATLLTLCGAGTLAAALLGVGDTSALNEKAAEASGIAQNGISDAAVFNAWPYVSAAGGALLLLAGLLALRYGAGWPSMSGSGRYERTGRSSRKGAARPAVDPERPEDLWKALDRGEDPT
ncbi:TIGR02234 family membrane protein [Streptomyces sp. NPDC054796]